MNFLFYLCLRNQANNEVCRFLTIKYFFMITLNVDYSEYSLVIQSLIAERVASKKMLQGENKKSPIYRLYSSQVKRIDLLLSKFQEGSL